MKIVPNLRKTLHNSIKNKQMNQISNIPKTLQKMKKTNYPLPHLPFRLPNKLLQKHLFRKLRHQLKINKLKTILFHFLQHRNNSFRFFLHKYHNKKTSVSLKIPPLNPREKSPPKKDVFLPLFEITEKQRGKKTAFFYGNLFIATTLSIPNTILSLPKKNSTQTTPQNNLKRKKTKSAYHIKKLLRKIALLLFFPPTHKTPETHLLLLSNTLKNKFLKLTHTTPKGGRRLEIRNKN